VAPRKIAAGNSLRKLPAASRVFISMMDETHDPVVTPGSPDPASPHHAPVKSTTQARAGVTFGTMRWVLTISMVAVALVFGILWLSASH
jgi:hypothetical protein